MALDLSSQQLMNSLPTQVVVIDRLGFIQAVNKSWYVAALSAGADPTTLGHGVSYFKSCETAKGDARDQALRILAGIKSVISGASKSFQDVYPCHTPIVERWFQIRCVPYDPPNHFLITHDDVTKKHLAERKMRHLAHIDELTKLPNRRGLDLQIDEKLEKISPETDWCMGLVDIDYFKKINDRFGHAVGDRVLFAVAQRMRRSLREHDVVGRYGGEEFLILLPDCDLRHGVETGNRLLLAISDQDFVVDAARMGVAITIGLLHTRGHACRKLLTAEADQALYEGKNNGRNQLIAKESATFVARAESDGLAITNSRISPLPPSQKPPLSRIKHEVIH